MQVSPTAPSDFFETGFGSLMEMVFPEVFFVKILEWFWDIFKAFLAFSENIFNVFFNKIFVYSPPLTVKQHFGLILWIQIIFY